MHLVARAAGADYNENDDVLEAGFSKHEDGSGIALMFQRARSAAGPWRGLPGQADLFNNTYCITALGHGQPRPDLLRRVLGGQGGKQGNLDAAASRDGGARCVR
jgi:hypothetical protein